MIIKSRQFTGFTLTEMLVAMAIVVLVGSVSLFSIKALMDTYESSDNALALIDAALSNAKAIAVKEGRYAGVRFQRQFDPDGIEKAGQYMIFVVEMARDEGKSKDETCYQAVKGRKPIKLPDSICVMDMRTFVTNTSGEDELIDEDQDLDDNLSSDSDDDDDVIADATSFTILFSPAGKLVIKDAVQMRNSIKEDDPDNTDGNTGNDSFDTIFNSPVNIMNGYGQFIQDDYPAVGSGVVDQGYGTEPSRSSFYVFSRKDFEEVDEDKRWSEFLVDIEPVYINPYSGNLIIEEKE